MKNWIETAENEKADYSGLVYSHNETWCSFFKKSNSVYKVKLSEAYIELESLLNSIKQPS